MLNRPPPSELARTASSRKVRLLDRLSRPFGRDPMTALRPCSSHNRRLPALWYNSLSLHRFPVQGQVLRGMARAFVRPVLAAFGLAALLCGCAPGAMIDKLPGDMALPADTPARPVTPYVYPAVHDMPPPRATPPMTEEQQVKLEKDLTAARERQETREKAAEAPEKPPKKKKSATAKKDTDATPRMAQRPTRDKSLPGLYRPAGQGSRPKGLRQWKTFTASAACRLTCSKK